MQLRKNVRESICVIEKEQESVCELLRKYVRERKKNERDSVCVLKKIVCVCVCVCVIEKEQERLCVIEDK